MRTGPRLLVAALAAGALALSGPAAQAKGSGSSGKKGTSSTKAPKVPALVADVARIEPLPVAAGASATTVEMEGVGEYRGILEVRRAGAGVGAVNEVALDDYLKGISEVPSSWPPEALRAQAIAARTYLLWVLGRGSAGEAAALGAQICATDSCQVYSGVAKERAPNGAAWAAAVRDTAGQVLLSGGAAILAKYSACNGGRTVSGGEPYLKAVDDPDDARCPLYRWGLAVSYDDLGRALAVPGTVKAVRATPGDVAVDWSADGGAGGHLTVPRTEFRAKVGAALPPPADRSKTVPSILFTLRPDDAGRVATLDGRGYGHGIGMSQWGAYGKALRGLKAPAILAAYYGGIQPTKLPPAKLPTRVRVAVEDGKPAKPGAAQPAGVGGAVVSASAPFRILDSRDNVVVPVAMGSWKVVPAGAGVRLVPPRDQAGPPGLSVLGIEPAVPLPGQPMTVRFKSNLPGIVSATAQPPGAGGPAVQVLAPQVVGTEERRLTLAAATQPGPYSLTLNADAGPGRTATLTVAPVVGDPNAPPPVRSGFAGGLLGLPPEAESIAGGTGQVLLSNEMLSALAVDAAPTTAAERPVSARRASRSSALRPVGSLQPPAAPGPSDRYGLGLILAGLAGLAVWRFRARTPPPAQPDSPGC
jgi:stage II sporulation protein D